MKTDPRFEEMWRDYLNDQLSSTELEAFMDAIRSGEHDRMIRSEMDRLFASGDSRLELSPQQAQEILIHIELLERQTSRVISFRRPARKTWYGLAAACVLAVFAFSGWILLHSKPVPPAALVRTGGEPENSIVHPKGKRFIKLPDASYVILNENSELDYPEAFDGPTREVTLKGEAYFDVRHVRSKPFIVHTGNINTIVLGTAFNISAFPDKKEIAVTVTRGKVAVGDKTRTYAVVNPNQQVLINTAKNEFSQSQVDAESVIAWKSLCLVLSDVSMEDAALIIGNRYHVKVIISNEKLKKCRITATFLEQENLDQVLSVVCGIVNASFVQQPNDQIIISGGDCSEP